MQLLKLNIEAVPILHRVIIALAHAIMSSIVTI